MLIREQFTKKRNERSRPTNKYITEVKEGNTQHKRSMFSRDRMLIIVLYCVECRKETQFA